MSTARLAPHPLLLDACCIINLVASGRMDEILGCIPYAAGVAALVKEQEALYVFSGPEGHETASKESIDLQPLADQGLLQIVRFDSEAEQETFLEFAAALGDDGEAMTGALAAHRTWALATDDRKATSFFSVRCPHVPIVPTLELVKYWAEHQHVSNDDVRTVLKNIRFRGRYVPPRNHALFGWWQTFLST